MNARQRRIYSRRHVRRSFLFGLFRLDRVNIFNIIYDAVYSDFLLPKAIAREKLKKGQSMIEAYHRQQKTDPMTNPNYRMIKAALYTQEGFESVEAQRRFILEFKKQEKSKHHG